MKKISVTEAPRAKVSVLDSHSYICDLINFEGPLLCLFRDSKHNWLYLWSDTDGTDYERWIIFRVERRALLGYLTRRHSLRELVAGSTKRYLLDQGMALEGATDGENSRRSLRQLPDLSCVAEYMPSRDSLFDPALAPDISLAQEVVPQVYDVPLDGEWFFSDLDRFSRLYSQLYSFFYCAKPRFITSIGERVRRYLHAPWKGGFSRVNLFEALGSFIPSLHDLKVHSIQYASPGQVKIEALQSVGDSISSAVLAYVTKQSEIDEAAKLINYLLQTTKLKRRDLSHLADSQLPLRKENFEFLFDKTNAIVENLSIAEEFSALCAQSPNAVVSAKVLLAVVGRISRMAKLQSAGLVPYDYSED